MFEEESRVPNGDEVPPALAIESPRGDELVAGEGAPEETAQPSTLTPEQVAGSPADQIPIPASDRSEATPITPEAEVSSENESSKEIMDHCNNRLAEVYQLAEERFGSMGAYSAVHASAYKKKRENHGSEDFTDDEVAALAAKSQIDLILNEFYGAKQKFETGSN